MSIEVPKATTCLRLKVAAAACLSMCMSGKNMLCLQVILELVFGMGPDRLTPELLERCHKAFVMWDANLFSFPVNLPGFGAYATCSTYSDIYSLFRFDALQVAAALQPACRQVQWAGSQICIDTNFIVLAAVAAAMHA